MLIYISDDISFTDYSCILPDIFHFCSLWRILITSIIRKLDQLTSILTVTLSLLPWVADGLQKSIAICVGLNRPKSSCETRLLLNSCIVIGKIAVSSFSYLPLSYIFAFFVAFSYFSSYSTRDSFTNYISICSWFNLESFLDKRMNATHKSITIS